MDNLSAQPATTGIRIRTVLVIVAFIYSAVIVWLFLLSPDDRSTGSWYRSHFTGTKEELGKISDALKTYKEHTGAYPTNDEGLAVLPEFKVMDYEGDIRMPLRWPGQEPTHSTIGPLSGWGVPYVYENRRGIAKEKFADSPVEKDTAGLYSLRVDDDIYVYSVEGPTLASEYRQNLQVQIVVYAMVLAFFLAAILSYAIPMIRKSKSRLVKVSRIAVRSVWYVFILLTSLILGERALTSTMCYVVEYFHRGKRPGYTAAYRQVLDKYKERGIIKEETYNTLLTNLEKEQKLLDKQEGIGN